MGLTSATTSALLRTAPVAKAPLKHSLVEEPHGLLQAPPERVDCIKKDYPFRCAEESEYGNTIDRYRRTTKQLLPIDPISTRKFCGKFLFCGWCITGYSLPHH